MQNGYGAVGGQGMTASFEFTVWDKDLIEKIKDAERRGKNVELEYRQAKWTWSCLQDSEYIATDIKEIDGSGQLIPYVVQQTPGRRK